MLLDVTLEYMKFHDTPILLQLSLDCCSWSLLWSLSKARCNSFCKCYPRGKILVSQHSVCWTL